MWGWWSKCSSHYEFKIKTTNTVTQPVRQRETEMMVPQAKFKKGNISDEVILEPVLVTLVPSPRYIYNRGETEFQWCKWD